MLDEVDDKTSSVDVIIRTFNSGRTLKSCLESVVKNISCRNIIVVDHNSSDDTVDISHMYNAIVVTEDKGLGYATTLGITRSDSEYILFVDSDITVTRSDFLGEAFKKIRKKRTGAVVGTAVGHPFLYGLPLGLTLFRRKDLEHIKIPPNIQGSETIHIRAEMRRKRLSVMYVSDAMVHNSVYRSYRYWPEWQGAQVRINSGLDLKELLYSSVVIFLILSNSKSMRNLVYYPIFLIKFLVGYTNPFKWKNMDRSNVSL